MFRIVVMGPIVLALAGCNAILGISEGTLKPDASAAGQGGGAGSGGSSTDASAGSGGTAGAGGAPGAGGVPGASGAAGSGGNTNGENCTNGKDDNGDGKIDCADPGCMKYGFKCQTIPSGWKGPIALYLGAFGDTPPSCSSAGNYPTAVLTGVSDPTAPAQCTCSCGAIVNATCEGPETHVYYDTTCSSISSGTLGISKYDAGTCVKFVQPDGGTLSNGSVKVFVDPFVTGGSCTPSAVKITLPSPWKDKAAACSGPASGWQAKGCPSGTQMCVPPAPSPFTKGTCIYRSGDVTCPSPSVFSNKFLVYDNQYKDDTRTCSPCECGPPQGDCSGKVSLFGSVCSGSPMVSVDFAGTCGQLNSLPTTFYGYYTVDKTQPTTKAFCPVSGNGGVASGGVTVTGTPTTICCP